MRKWGITSVCFPSSSGRTSSEVKDAITSGDWVEEVSAILASICFRSKFFYPNILAPYQSKREKTYLNRECNENVPKQINSSAPPLKSSFFFTCSYLACERILSSDFVCRRLQGIFPLTRISDQDAFKLYNSVSVPSIISTDFSDFPWCFMYVNTLEG